MLQCSAAGASWSTTMKQLVRECGHAGGVFAIAALCFCTLSIQPTFAQTATTGVVAGIVTDTTNGKPLANVHVTAASPSGTGTGITDGRGFYNIPNLLPDTYVVSFQLTNYQAAPVSGVTVYADQTYTVNSAMSPSLRTIATVRARSAANLAQPGQTADVYNLSTAQLQAAQGADNLHKTLYQYVQSVPGVTVLGAGGVPRIRGGNSTGTSYELDGVPINDRLTGLFTTNLSNLGVNSVEFYTGGYNARYGHAAAGIINTTVKTGTYPGFSLASVGYSGPAYNHALTLEHGGATPDGKFTYYIGFDGVNSANAIANGYTFPYYNLGGDDVFAPDVYTRDIIGNVHYRLSNRDDLQLLFQNGYGRFAFDYLQTGPYTPMQIVPCSGVTIGPNYTLTSGGTSVSGAACNTPTGTPSGLQFVPIDPYHADVYHHYSGIGKFQWNHSFNEKIYASLRFAENFNQYIFEQPYDTPNWGNLMDNTNGPFGAAGIYNTSAFNPSGQLFLTAGTPALGGGADLGAEDFYGDRRSNIWVGSYDLTYTPTEFTQIYGGVSYEWDNDWQAYYDREGEYNPYGSAFNQDGSWPFNTLLVNYPLSLPSAYAGVRQNLGKWTIEPSVRYEHIDYLIPRKQTFECARKTSGACTGVQVPAGFTGGSYGMSAWQPRFSFSYAFSPNTIVRGSYALTANFIPAAYFFNNSPNGTDVSNNRVENPYDPNAPPIFPEIDNNADFSIEHLLGDGRTSIRITPYYHESRNQLTFFKNFTIVNGTVQTHGPSLLKTNGVSKNFGVEFGLNHLETGVNAFSWFLSATYLNSWSSSQTLTTAITNFSNLNTFLLNGTLYHPAGNPPVSVSLTADLKLDRLHVDPYALWQCCAWYNVFGADAPTTWPFFKSCTAAGVICDVTPHQSPGYWWTQLSVSYDIVKHDDGHRVTLGVLAQNLNNILRGPIPSANDCYNNLTRPGCTGGGFDNGLFFAGEQLAPGVVPFSGYAFVPDSQQPRSVEVFLTIRE